MKQPYIIYIAGDLPLVASSHFQRTSDCKYQWHSISWRESHQSHPPFILNTPLSVVPNGPEYVIPSPTSTHHGFWSCLYNMNGGWDFRSCMYTHVNATCIHIVHIHMLSILYIYIYYIIYIIYIYYIYYIYILYILYICVYTYVDMWHVCYTHNVSMFVWCICISVCVCGMSDVHLHTHGILSRWYI